MIRKLLCWLGWHEWEQRCTQPKSFCHRAIFDFWYADCDGCKYKQIYCKCCRKIKK